MVKRYITRGFVAAGDLLRHAPDRVTEALLALPCAPLPRGADRVHCVRGHIQEGNSPCCLPDAEAAMKSGQGFGVLVLVWN
jgi:hypothetical protein